MQALKLVKVSDCVTCREIILIVNHKLLTTKTREIHVQDMYVATFLFIRVTMLYEMVAVIQTKISVQLHRMYIH